MPNIFSLIGCILIKKPVCTGQIPIWWTFKFYLFGFAHTHTKNRIGNHWTKSIITFEPQWSFNTNYEHCLWPFININSIFFFLSFCSFSLYATPQTENDCVVCVRFREANIFRESCPNLRICERKRVQWTLKLSDTKKYTTNQNKNSTARQEPNKQTKIIKFVFSMNQNCISERIVFQIWIKVELRFDDFSSDAADTSRARKHVQAHLYNSWCLWENCLWTFCCRTSNYLNISTFNS